jgi:nucleotide-binding universal stress UspA family protein
VSRLRRVLHATDFSPASQRAFAQALEMAEQNKGDLMLLHVLTPIANYVIGDHYTDPSLYARLEETAESEAEKGLAKLAQRARKAGVKVKSMLARGTTHEEILRAARRWKADLIVIGTHGRTGLSKLLMGSVAGRIVSNATCPVLTVRGR